MKNFKSVFYCVALLVASYSGNASADTISYSEIFMIGGGTSLTSTDTGFLVSMDSLDLGTLAQFDPSLGTLTSATFSIDGEILFDVSVVGDVVLDDSMDHEVDAIFVVGVGIGAPSGGSFILTTEELLFDGVSCFGSAGEPECTDGYGGLTFVSTTDSLSDLTPFIGSGFLDDFTLEMLGGLESMFLDNLDEGFLDLFGDFEGEVTVTYEYSPVPVPAAVWLFASALLGLGGIKRGRL